MPRAAVNGIELEYDTFGDPHKPPLVLIMGLGAQMILWEEEFCEELAASGFFVVRFDNRDVGMSTQLDAAGVPNVFEAMQAALAGKPVQAPYTLARWPTIPSRSWTRSGSRGRTWSARRWAA